MLEYIKYLGIPAQVAFALITLFFVVQAIGEILKVKGMIVPEILNVRSYFARKKREKETLCKMQDLIPLIPALERVPETLESVTALLNSVDRHYNSDNIAMRDNWMKGVDSNIDEMRCWMQRLDAKLDKNSQDTLAIRIDNMRNTIIDFAAYVSEDNNQVTREQFTRVFKMYEEYEAIITENRLTNGEVDIAIHIIRESYEKHLRKHNFIEDVWGLETQL